MCHMSCHVSCVMFDSWFRAGVEHVFGHMKRFAVIGSRYRGRLREDKGRIFAATVIIASTLAIRISHRPLRNHSWLLRFHEDDVDDDGGDDDDNKEEKEEIMIGNPAIDIILGPSGVARGRGPEPSNAAINSGCTVNDFTIGDHVYVWWWGKWWEATVKDIAYRVGTITIRWKWSKKSVAGYLPRLLRLQ
jgi:hypothetical protein